MVNREKIGQKGSVTRKKRRRGILVLDMRSMRSLST
jgi:hypothetical protein